MKKECRTYFALLSDYIDGELDPETRQALEAHLEKCRECSQCLLSLKRSIELYHETSGQEAPPEVVARLKSALKECMEHTTE
jgi:anti-sigma factor RsiW